MRVMTMVEPMVMTMVMSQNTNCTVDGQGMCEVYWGQDDDDNVDDDNVDDAKVDDDKGKLNRFWTRKVCTEAKLPAGLTTFQFYLTQPPLPSSWPLSFLVSVSSLPLQKSSVFIKRVKVTISVVMVIVILIIIITL